MLLFQTTPVFPVVDIIFSAAALLALVGVVWKQLNNKIDTLEKDMKEIQKEMTAIRTNYLDRFTQAYQETRMVGDNLTKRMNEINDLNIARIDEVRDIIHGFASKLDGILTK